MPLMPRYVFLLVGPTYQEKAQELCFKGLDYLKTKVMEILFISMMLESKFPNIP